MKINKTQTILLSLLKEHGILSARQLQDLTGIWEIEIEEALEELEWAGIVEQNLDYKIIGSIEIDYEKQEIKQRRIIKYPNAHPYDYHIKQVKTMKDKYNHE